VELHGASLFLGLMFAVGEEGGGAECALGSEKKVPVQWHMLTPIHHNNSIRNAGYL
jgi:hypothetical protein